MNFEFNLRTKTWVGKGSLARIPDFLTKAGYLRAGLVIDQNLKGVSLISDWVGKLKKWPGLSVTVEYYYDLAFEPDYDSLDRIKMLFKEGESSKVDVIIAIGGGSTIDMAKGIATLIHNHEKAITYRGFPENLKPSVPVVAAPTTAGTGSEVTFNAVFTDYHGEKKLGINTHNNFPVLAVLDSDLTKSCPYAVALSSGLDALVHTLESFACKQHNLYTRMFACEAFSYLINNLEAALTGPDDDQVRENMLFGSYLAAVSLFNSGSGPAGAISYALGVVCKIPHGLAGGLVLPYLIKHNVERGYTDYSMLYDRIEKKDHTALTPEEKSQRMVDHFFELYERLNVWKYAEKYKMDPENNQSLTAYLDSLQGAYDQNPYAFTSADSKNILKQITQQTHARI